MARTIRRRRTRRPPAGTSLMLWPHSTSRMPLWLQGNCSSPPSEADLMVLTQTPDAVALLPLQPQQCLVLTNDDLLPIVSPRCGLRPLPCVGRCVPPPGSPAATLHPRTHRANTPHACRDSAARCGCRVWVDNLYLRAVAVNPVTPDRSRHYIGLVGSAPSEWPLTGQGRRFVTRTTLQGDGLGPSTGLWANEATYAESAPLSPPPPLCCDTLSSIPHLRFHQPMHMQRCVCTPHVTPPRTLRFGGD